MGRPEARRSPRDLTESRNIPIAPASRIFHANSSLQLWGARPPYTWEGRKPAGPHGSLNSMKSTRSRIFANSPLRNFGFPHPNPLRERPGARIRTRMLAEIKIAHLPHCYQIFSGNTALRHRVSIPDALNWKDQKPADAEIGLPTTHTTTHHHYRPNPPRIGRIFPGDSALQLRAAAPCPPYIDKPDARGISRKPTEAKIADRPKKPNICWELSVKT